MNQKARKLSKEIESREKLRQNLLESQEKQLKQFDEEYFDGPFGSKSYNNKLYLRTYYNGKTSIYLIDSKNIERKISTTTRTENPHSKATNAWCRITNALIRKYKPMTEQDPNKALKELTRIEGALLAGGFLTEQELKEAL